MSTTKKRTIVCLCGSTKFWKEYQEANYRETMAGKIVLTVGHYPHTTKRQMQVDGCMGVTQHTVETIEHGGTRHCTPAEKIKLDELHLDKIAMSDEVLILNVGGYCGESTTREIVFAFKAGKPIRWLEPDTIPDHVLEIIGAQFKPIFDELNKK